MPFGEVGEVEDVGETGLAKKEGRRVGEFVGEFDSLADSRMKKERKKGD